MWSGISVWRWFIFPWLLMMLSIFSSSCLLPISTSSCGNVYSNPLSSFHPPETCVAEKQVEGDRDRHLKSSHLLVCSSSDACKSWARLDWSQELRTLPGSALARGSNYLTYHLLPFRRHVNCKLVLGTEPGLEPNTQLWKWVVQYAA